MGARGPKADPNQAAKGFPGRRKAKAKKVAITAAKLTRLLQPRAADAELPPLLQDPKYAPAAAVWRRVAPELRRTHRLPPESEFYFVQVCIYTQEWVSSTEDLHANGFTQDVQTVAGGTMERRRPKQFDRQQAYSNLMELSVKFGLTPNDMYSLFKGQAAVAMSNPGLFDETRRAPVLPPAGQAADAETDEDAAPPPATPGRVGALAGMRSTPPGERPN